MEWPLPTSPHRRRRQAAFGLLALVLAPSVPGRGAAWLLCGGAGASAAAPATLLPAQHRLLATRVPRLQAAAGSSSGFSGVTRHEGSSQWQAHVKDPAGGEDISLGLFKSERDAAKAFDRASLALGAPQEATNFPAGSYEPEEVEEESQRLSDNFRPRPSAKYHGVYQTRLSGAWKAEIELFGVKQFLDFFGDELDAARAVDDAIRSTGAEKATRLRMLNFRGPDDYFSEDSWEEEQIPRGATSRFLGVTYHQPSGRFLAKLGRRHIGLFDTEPEAACAFDEASHAKGGPTNFAPPS